MCHKRTAKKAKEQFGRSQKSCEYFCLFIFGKATPLLFWRLNLKNANFWDAWFFAYLGTSIHWRMVMKKRKCARKNKTKKKTFWKESCNICVFFVLHFAAIFVVRCFSLVFSMMAIKNCNVFYLFLNGRFASRSNVIVLWLCCSPFLDRKSGKVFFFLFHTLGQLRLFLGIPGLKFICLDII